MQKTIYLLYVDPSEDAAKLRESLLQTAVPTLRSCGATKISLFVSDDEVAAGRPTRRSDPPIRAMVSFWLHESADRLPVHEALSARVSRIAGYHVHESRPIDHVRPEGARTRGMVQISCIEKRPELSADEFRRIWQDDHREVAIETQSTFGYVRNEVLGSLTPDTADSWSAIVEESFPIEALDDPWVFFDSKSQSEYEANVQRMIGSCQRFMRLDSLEVLFASEYALG